MASATDQQTAQNVPQKGGVFALGNFDGVHRGHQAVLKLAIEKARGLGVPARAMTFEPHPRSVLKPDIPPFRLTPAAAKDRLLRKLGLDDVVVLPFTPGFSDLSAQDFVQRVLLGTYGAQHVVAGFDYVFGHRRSGTMAQLREWLAPQGVSVTEVTPFRDSHGEVMSSSRTRDALKAGDVALAEHILGRPWSIAGMVVKGDQRGRQLGFPTMNIPLGEYMRPRFGVYTITASPVGSARQYAGIANLGLRPTVDGKTELLEAHLFDFHQEVYGQEWEVYLCHFQRDEQSFGSLEALKQQITLDVDAARTYHA
ncbi:MAG: bifunctional riboflavin kinase/FAD synthetase, partial [Alphaproteobacteria bacterium]|nr:bifunctional riboflavin kinase/FAD synthetase [Alphaproteobacteria bacterium]